MVDLLLDHAYGFHLMQFNIPNLRVGTLDSLLALSDDLLKVSFEFYLHCLRVLETNDFIG